MNRIEEAIQKVISGSLAVERRPGFCQKFVRQVVEAAFGLPSHAFYKKYNTRPVVPEHPGDVWARDLEAGIRSALTASAWRGSPDSERLKPGALVFRYNVSFPYGHVGIFIGKYPFKVLGFTRMLDAVIENTDARRGIRLGGALAITPLRQWGTPTLVVPYLFLAAQLGKPVPSDGEVKA